MKFEFTIAPILGFLVASNPKTTCQQKPEKRLQSKLKSLRLKTTSFLAATSNAQALNTSPLTSCICRLLLPSPEGISRGQALLLVKTRILRPRSDRGVDAKCPRHSPACWPWPCPVHARVQSENSPRPCLGHARIHVRGQSAYAPGSPPAPRESPFDCVARCASSR